MSLVLRLFLYPDKLSRRAIHIHNQFGIVTAVSVDHMPDEHIRRVTPIEHVKDGTVRSLLQQLVAAVLLRNFKSLVRVDL